MTSSGIDVYVYVYCYIRTPALMEKKSKYLEHKRGIYVGKE